MTCREQLQQQCAEIARFISKTTTYVREGLEYLAEEFGDSPDSLITPQAYLSGNFGISVTSDLEDGTYQSCEITVATGGPGIYLVTNAYNSTVHIQGRWAGTNVDVYCEDNLLIDEYVEELYNCRRNTND